MYFIIMHKRKKMLDKMWFIRRLDIYYEKKNMK